MEKERLVFSKGQQGGKSLVVWGAMSLDEVSSLMLMRDKHTSVTYSQALRYGPLDLMERPLGYGFIFQDDKGARHKIMTVPTNWTRMAYARWTGQLSHLLYTQSRTF